MFGGGDPFGDPFTHMRRQMHEMDRMMEAMMDPFGMMDPFFGNRQRFPVQNMIENGSVSNTNRNRQVPNHRNQVYENPMNMGMMPFGGGLFGGGLFGGINNMMQQMEGLSQHAINDPNSHVYSQSTVISFDGSGNGPKVVQESVRKHGDVKETRRSVQNGMDGLAEMEVGHHMGNKAHFVEKKRDKDGKVRQQQRFVNLDEDEADDFTSEFKSRAQRNMGNLFGASEDLGRNRAIEDGPSSKSRSSKPNRETTRSTTSYSDHSSGSGGAHAPIVTIPDDDDYEERRNRRSNRDYYYPNSTGPTIREISEEEADMSIPKRRKGMFGRFFKDD